MATQLQGSSSELDLTPADEAAIADALTALIPRGSTPGIRSVIDQLTAVGSFDRDEGVPGEDQDDVSKSILALRGREVRTAIAKADIGYRERAHKAEVTLGEAYLRKSGVGAYAERDAREQIERTRRIEGGRRAA
jgi:hypothetical protein